MSAAASGRERVLIGLAGQPNVGKTTVFNLLTGLEQHVGNWAGKTVERAEGTVRHEGVEATLVDLPGTYSLTANSPEERVARDFLIFEKPDVVMVIADASALERSLYLLAELLALGLDTPIVLGLNMTDVAASQGIDIDPEVFAAALGLPVVPLVARRAQGVAALVGTALRLAGDPSACRPVRPEIAAPHREVLAAVHALLEGHVPAPYPAHWVAMKLLEGDGELIGLARQWAPEPVWAQIEALLGEHEDAVLDIAAGRYEWIERMARAAVRRPRLGQVSLTDRLDRVALHPVWGLVLLMGVFAFIFGLTFELAGPVQDWLESGLIEPLGVWLGERLANAPPWVSGLLVDGVLGGAGTVITFVPLLAVFFAALALLEDTGYFARAAYVMDRYMHRMGLHGKSFLPLCLGFGCNVPAVMGARVIDSPSGRLLTILLAPLVPCSARLLVLAFLAPVFFGEVALPVTLAFIGLNLVLVAVAGSVFNRSLFRGKHVFFIMEMPLYHVPSVRTIGRFVRRHVIAFLRNAGSLILIFSVVLWVLAYFPGEGLEQSWLGRFGQGIAPVSELLGLDWRLIVALLASFVAKENAIAALGILYGIEGEGQALAEVLSASISTGSALAFLTATMLFIPCVATLVVMRTETGSWRWPMVSVALHLALSIAGAMVVYWSWVALAGA